MSEDIVNKLDKFTQQAIVSQVVFFMEKDVFYVTEFDVLSNAINGLRKSLGIIDPAISSTPHYAALRALSARKYSDMPDYVKKEIPSVICSLLGFDDKEFTSLFDDEYIEKIKNLTKS
ncbi:hypothetical protein [Dickeya sp. NCPPB 3274]|uniref:hypothetical protein n=1 Tax=Dickeya sp. NCPPB 3274 TaxID=568766 RepID=UPI00039A6AE0|nr:hypothetical protein [Dickeya sp. NCPPB 3274]